MKTSILIFLLSIPTLIISQSSGSLSYRLSKIVTESQLQENKKSLDKEIHLILKGDTKAIQQFLLENNGTIKYQYNSIFAVRMPLRAIEKLANLAGLEKAEIHNQALEFNDIKAIQYTAVDTVHAGGGLLLNSYTGKGVVVGVIDSGIDPTHPDFKNDNGTTRILAFWDQNNTQSSLPPYGYGKEYTEADINNGLMASYLDTTFNGHGTAVTSMAAGGGKTHANVKGMAPEAGIIVVGINPSTLDYLDRTPSMLAIVDGIDYIFNKAESMGMPAVINISLGGMEGSHDAKDLPTRLIEGMLDAKSGRALVVSSGNSAATKHHIGFDVQNETLFTWFEGMYSNSSVCKRDSGAYMSFYGDSLDVINLTYNIGAEEQNPCCNILDETGFRPFIQTLGQLKVDTLKSGNTVIGVVTTFVEKIEDTYALFMEVESVEMDLLWRFSFAGNGKVDGWGGPTTKRSCNSTYILYPFLVGNASQIDNYDNYVTPDNNQTVGNAYACSDKVITVGAYSVNQNMLDVDSVNRTYFITPKGKAGFSSLGPTRDGRIKPDISGPGSRIIVAQASQVLADKAANSRATLYVSGMHSITDGTSFSSPAVAGIVALYFEKYPNATYQNVKEAMITTAYQDALTGLTPNNDNGYGRINAYQMLLSDGINSVEDVTVLDALVYPNPSNGQFYVELPNTIITGELTMQIYDLRGMLIQQKVIQESRFSINLAASGFYILQLTNSTGKTFISKIIVE